MSTNEHGERDQAAPLRVLLAQLPVPNNPATNVPLAAGYLKAYAHARGLLGRAQLEILPRALADHAGDATLVDAIVARRPHVLGLSLYTWNSERTLELARRAKQRLPGLLVVGGGPEVQRDNEWVLRQPALDVAVIGEGEQTFAELLELLLGQRQGMASIPGLAYRDERGELAFTPERVPLAQLDAVPSPYLLGYLEVEPGGMLMVEVSRWCPYACSFCLYGRNMGTRLGGRLFGLERLLDEIRWGLERGAASVHFIEANLNLVPVFQPLMRALADMNAGGRLALYAELRGEHLSDAAADALARAGLRVAEVGLQTANPAALRAAHRRTDLAKWAAGTRRLYERGVEVLLDVILGLPEDDAAGVESTLAFIRSERLGPYDAFTLQMLPGVELRRQAAQYRIASQERPPYYVLGTDRFSYAELRRLRRDLKAGAGHDPDAVEGCPEPDLAALARGPRCAPGEADPAALVSRLALPSAAAFERALDGSAIARLAAHLSLTTTWDALQRHTKAGSAEEPPSHPATRGLHAAIAANPTTLIDIYLVERSEGGHLPSPEELRAWRESLPHAPGYLDRVAVYRRAEPSQGYDRVSPRVFLVLPWVAQVEPDAYRGAAEIIWEHRVAEGEEPPLGAWASAGGAGVWVRGACPEQVAAWRERTGVRLWHDVRKHQHPTPVTQHPTPATQHRSEAP